MKILLTLCCFLINTTIFAQWTWMKGPSQRNKYGIYGTQGIASTTNRPGGREEFTSWKDHDGNFWLFGGFGLAKTQQGWLNDLWKYEPATNKWTWVSGDSTANVQATYGIKGVASPINKISGRGHSTGWCDSFGNFWIYGGELNDATPLHAQQMMGDLWKYNSSTGLWTWMTGATTGFQHPAYGDFGIASSFNTPGARTLATGWADNNGHLFLFAGMGRLENDITHPVFYLNNLWKYTIETNQWAWINGPNEGNGTAIYGTRGAAAAQNIPCGKYSPITFADEAGNCWMFGGSGTDNLGNYGPMNDLWKYNRTTNQWTWISGDTVCNTPGIYGTKGIEAPTNRPGGRIWLNGGYGTDGNIWIFGGIGKAATPLPGNPNQGLNDLWLYKPATDQWTWLAGDSIQLPTAVFGNIGVSSPSNTPAWKYLVGSGWTDNEGNFWVFGGQGGSTSITGAWMSDLWKYNPRSTVPVSLLSFTGMRDRDIAKLSWKTANEINLDHYNIERSFNAVKFEKIGQVKATNAGQYYFNDNSKEIAGRTVFYRLAMVDIDAKSGYSNIVALNTGTDQDITISPNPATTQAILYLNNNITGELDIHILDMSGRILTKETHTANGAGIVISTGRLAAGTYLLTIFNKGKRYYTRLVVSR